MGDAVFGVAPGCLGEAVVGPAQLLAPLPPGLGFSEAANVPTVYATVLAAFDGSAVLGSGHTVAARPTLTALAGLCSVTAVKHAMSGRHRAVQILAIHASRRLHQRWERQLVRDRGVLPARFCKAECSFNTKLI